MGTSLRPCPNCGRPMDVNRMVCVFCQQAGSQQSQAQANPSLPKCPNCGRAMYPGQAVCFNCQRAGQTPPAAPQSIQYAASPQIDPETLNKAVSFAITIGICGLLALLPGCACGFGPIALVLSLVVLHQMRGIPTFPGKSWVIVGLVGGLIGTGFWVVMPIVGGSQKSATSSPDVTRQQFETVAGVVRGSSPIVTVEPFDPNYPNTMRIIIASGNVSSYDARKIAVTARERLGEKAIVYVKDDTGKTLAKAAPWGVE